MKGVVDRRGEADHSLLLEEAATGPEGSEKIKESGCVQLDTTILGVVLTVPRPFKHSKSFS